MITHEKLRELANKATSGPWECGLRNYDKSFVVHKNGHVVEWSEKNMCFIAAANPETVLSLLDEIDRLRSALTSIASLDYPEHVSEEFWKQVDYKNCAKLLSLDVKIARDALAYSAQMEEKE